MYTNPITGTLWDDRHLWYPVDAEMVVGEGLASEAMACACGEAHTSSESSLVPVRDFDVEDLAHFLILDRTCIDCADEVADTVGYTEADLNEATHDAQYVAVDDPQEVVEQYHKEGTEQVRDDQYGEQPDLNLLTDLGGGMGGIETPDHDVHLYPPSANVFDQPGKANIDSGERALCGGLPGDQKSTHRGGVVLEAWLGSGTSPEDLATLLDQHGDKFCPGCLAIASDRHGWPEYGYQSPLTQAMKQDSLTLDDVEINQYTQPMHLFVEGDVEAICGISVEDANEQGNTFSRSGGTFTAANNYDSMDDLVENFVGGTATCQECADGIQDLAQDRAAADSR